MTNSTGPGITNRCEAGTNSNLQEVCRARPGIPTVEFAPLPLLACILVAKLAQMLSQRQRNQDSGRHNTCNRRKPAEGSSKGGRHRGSQGSSQPGSASASSGVAPGFGSATVPESAAPNAKPAAPGDVKARNGSSAKAPPMERSRTKATRDQGSHDSGNYYR